MLSQAAASKAGSKLAPIQEVVKSVAAGAAGELLALPCAPPLTWNVLRAMLLVMGKPPQDIDTWLKCRYASCIEGYVNIAHVPGQSFWQQMAGPTASRIMRRLIREISGCIQLAAGSVLASGRLCAALLAVFCTQQQMHTP